LLDVIGFADIIPDSGLVSKVISALADELEMKTIGRVRISEDKNGSYYMQLIRESHMFVYVSNNGLIIFSILSCRYFDQRKTTAYVKSGLKIR